MAEAPCERATFYCRALARVCVRKKNGGRGSLAHVYRDGSIGSSVGVSCVAPNVELSGMGALAHRSPLAHSPRPTAQKAALVGRAEISIVGHHRKTLEPRIKGDVDQTHLRSHPMRTAARGGDPLVFHEQKMAAKPCRQRSPFLGILGQEQFVPGGCETNIAEVDPESCVCPAPGVERHQGRVGEEFLDVLGDDRGFPYDDVSPLEHGDLTVRRNAVEPCGLIVQIDLVEGVRDPLLAQKQPGARWA